MINNYWREIVESREKRKKDRLMILAASVTGSFFAGIYLAAFTFAHLQ